MKIPFRHALFSVLITGAMASLGSASANANTWTVNSVVTGGNSCTSTCSLYEAMFYAASGDSIVFDPVAFSTPQTMVWPNGQFQVDKNLTITGPGPGFLTINGNFSRVFIIPGSTTLSISGITFTGSYETGISGGSILNSGTLSLSNVRFTGNTAAQSTGGALNNDSGGVVNITNSQFDLNHSITSTGSAIINNGTATISNTSFTSNDGTPIDNRASMTIANSTFSGNTTNGSSAGVKSSSFLAMSGCTFYGNVAGNNGQNSTPGSGGAMTLSGFADINNTTISSNIAFGNGTGGGIYFSGGIARLTNVTITGNTALFGGGIYVESDPLSLRNSIVAGNPTVVGSDVSGPLLTNANNVIGGDPRLAPLGNYGGSGFTHALLSGSPAINTGDNCVLTANSCPDGSPSTAITTDARGAARVGNVDIGAFEVNSPQNGGSYVVLLATQKVAQNFSQTIVPEAGATTYCVSTGILPPGVTGIGSCLPLRTAKVAAPASAIVIGGTPTIGGLYNFAIQATSGGNTNVTNYRIRVLAPSAAPVTIAGRVLSADGRGVAQATVQILGSDGAPRQMVTGPFGYFSFDEVASGQSYVVSVSSKQFTFASRLVNVEDPIADLDFRAEPAGGKLSRFMAIYLGGETTAAVPKLDDLTPREIVAELDKYVVGQAAAKRAVAVALRNRIRRQKLEPEIAEDVLPKNILMIGSTGVGKTEIARRLAKLANSPFIKIEASKFTEVGYVGRDVESMVRELVDVAVDMAKQTAFEDIKPRAEQNVEEKLLDILLPPSTQAYTSDLQENEIGQPQSKTREKLREQLRRGELDERMIDIDTQDRSTATIDFIGGQGMDDMGVNLRDMFGNMFPSKTVNRKATIGEAREILLRDELEKLTDMESVTRSAIEKTEQSGIIFLDEIDKIAGRESGGNPAVSREGVQRDLLPIVEGTNVNTKYGMVSTDHILFVAAGAFHVAKPSDLIPELQGRFPIRVELEALTIDDLKRILTQPKNSLIKQYQALLGTEGITLKFTEDAIDKIAEMTEELNKSTENIGARRLHTLVEKLLEEISFEGSELKEKTQTIDAAYVTEKLGGLIQDQDLRQYVL